MRQDVCQCVEECHASRESQRDFLGHFLTRRAKPAQRTKAGASPSPGEHGHKAIGPHVLVQGELLVAVAVV